MADAENDSTDESKSIELRSEDDETEEEETETVQLKLNDDNKKDELSDSEIDAIHDRTTRKYSILRRMPTMAGLTSSWRNAVQNFIMVSKHNIHQWLYPKECLVSRGLSLLDIEELLMLCPLSTRQLCVLMDEYLRLCGINAFDAAYDDEQIRDIALEEMMQTIYLRYNPWKQRIQSLFERDMKKYAADMDLMREYVDDAMTVTFIDFCKCLSVFAEKTPKASKLRFACQIYDIEGDGFISPQNVFDVLQMVVGDQFDDDELNKIVHKTFETCSLNSTGNLEYQEFTSLVGVTDIISNLTIAF